MPRSSGRRSSPTRASSPSRRPSPPPQQKAAPPPPQPPAPIAAQPAAVGQPMSPGGGLMANIASTAAGVAIGHTIGHAITGAFSGGSDAVAEPAPAQAQAPQPINLQQANYQRPVGGGYCEQEFQQFIRCTQEQPDISLCSGYNELLKECKLRQNI